MKLKELKEDLIASGSLCGTPALFFVLPEEGEEAALDLSLEELLQKASLSTARYMVVKGGALLGQRDDVRLLLEGLSDLFRHTVVECDGKEEPSFEPDLYSLILTPRGGNWPEENIEKLHSAGRPMELKITIEDEIDLRETLIALSRHDVPRSSVFFLPAGSDSETFLENAVYLKSECLKYGFRLGWRTDLFLGENDG